MKKITAYLLAILLIAGNCIPSLATGNEKLNADKKASGSNGNEINIPGERKDEALNLLEKQVDGKLKKDEKGKFIIILKDPVDIEPQERVNHKRQIFGEECKKLQENFLKEIKKKNLSIELKNTYDLLFCGVSIKTDYRTAKEIARFPEVESIEYCIEYKAPVVKEVNKINKRDIDSNEMISLPEIESNYKGEGRVVAIIDSGFDHKHHAMRISDGVTKKNY